MKILFSFTIFTGAFLLFLIQPMFARMALPLLGGSPSVWNIAMVFFQATLLFGYLYTHLSVKYLSLKKQIGGHCLVFCFCLFFLPPSIGSKWTDPPELYKSFWLLGLLASSVGVAFFINSTASPLLQKWFSATDHKDSDDPYFLYSASNAGSMISLLAYPFLVEPYFTLKEQTLYWSMGLGALFVLTLACGIFVARKNQAGNIEDSVSEAGKTKGSDGAAKRTSQSGAEVTGTVEPSDGAEPVLRKEILYWILLAFVPSSLLLGVTTHITTDIASVPLLWIIPLVLYLLSFIIAFARRQLVSLPFLVKIQSMLMVVLTIVFYLAGLRWPLILHCLMFFVSATICHSILAKRRPHVAHLTYYFFWMSFGGVLGGIFNALLSPVIFTSVAEYPLVLVIACLLASEDKIIPSIKDFVFPAILPGFTALALAYIVPAVKFDSGNLMVPIMAIACGISYIFVTKRLRFTIAISLLLITGFMFFREENVVFCDRSFFGVHRVKKCDKEGLYKLYHATTLHGVQRIDEKTDPSPLMYYYPSGPLGQVLGSEKASKPGLIVGTAGLGAGCVASYGKVGQQYRFYEIDPVVCHVASNMPEFTFLSDCKADVSVIKGDARHTIGKEKEGFFDILIIDVFSGDSIPVHLMTSEAFALYESRLKENGILVIHISNGYLNLEPVLQKILSKSEMTGLICEDLDVSAEDFKNGKIPSTWVVAARSESILMKWVSIKTGGSDTRKQLSWKALKDSGSVRLWTDNYSNILDILRF